MNANPSASVKFGVQLKTIVPRPSFLAAAKKEGRGTVIFNWTPNFTDANGFVFIAVSYTHLTLPTKRIV